MSDNDFDLSAGPALVASTGAVIGADKGGLLYLVSAAAMKQSAAPGAAAIGTHQLSSGSIFNLAVWNQPHGALIYLQGTRDSLKCFRLTGDSVDETPVSSATDTQTYSRLGLTLSAAGTSLDSGILWQTTGNFNDPTSPGVLHAYKASDLSVELWNSSMNAEQDQMGAISKFTSPTVANGRVFVPTFSNELDVYGLFTPDEVPAPAPSRPGRRGGVRGVIR